jgi:hypothetical protein
LKSDVEEEAGGVCIDEEGADLESGLDETVKEGEDDVYGCQTGEGQSVPLEKHGEGQRGAGAGKTGGHTTSFNLAGRGR